MTTSTNIPVAYIIKASTIVKRLAYLIAVIGTVASYGTQVELLLSWGLGLFAYVIPATIDLLAICAAIALQVPGLDSTSRKIAGVILTIAVIVSVVANVNAGHNVGARLAHAWPVVAYLLAELIANRIRLYVARVLAAEAAAKAPQIVVQAPMPAPVKVDVTPVVAAVTVARNAAPVTRTTHANCEHPTTSSARAACRKLAMAI
jgi:hypothetical protein